MTLRRVTLVGHDASRTGAPILLRSLLRWLHGRGLCEANVVLRRGGPLVDDYRKLAPCRVMDSVITRSLDRVGAGVGSIRGTQVEWTPRRGISAGSGPGPDVVVANTLAALELAASLVGRGSRLVCHVHELDHVADRVLTDSPRRSRLLASVDQFIATGPAVGAMLTQRWGMDDAKVSVVDGFIERPNPTAGSVASARTEFSRLGDGPVLLSVGAMSRRKGPEVFTDLVGLLADNGADLVGVWLGGDPNSVAWKETLDDIARSGAQVTVMPWVADAHRYVAAADILVSTAVEDPFPLAAMEAAALGVPVVGFASGGLGHMVNSAGCPDMVVPLGDLFLMERRINELLKDPERRAQQGQKLQRWVCESHMVDNLAPALWKSIVG